MAKEQNINKYFFVWGTCLGFESIISAESKKDMRKKL